SMNCSRSLVKARSFSLAGSILAKSGMLRRTSTSWLRLIGPDLLLFGSDQLVQRAAVLVERRIVALLDDLTALHDQNVVEPLRPVAATERPEHRAALERLEDRVEHGVLLRRVERPDRIVGD